MPPFSFKSISTGPPVFDAADPANQAIVEQYSREAGWTEWEPWMLGIMGQREDVVQVLEYTIGGRLEALPAWREMMMAYLTAVPAGMPTDRTAWDCMDPQLDAAFAQLTADLCEGDQHSVFDSLFDHNTKMSMRLPLIWCMLYSLEALGVLLDAGVVHVGQQLFPERVGAVSSDGCRINLLGLAAIDCQSAPAVRFLISRGADPHGIVNVSGSTDRAGPTAVALHHVTGHWRGELSAYGAVPSPSTVTEVLSAFFEAGANPIDAHSVYLMHQSELPGIAAFCASHCKRYLETRRANAKQRWTNVVALVGIVAAWRRITYTPGSKVHASTARRFHVMQRA